MAPEAESGPNEDRGGNEASDWEGWFEAEVPGVLKADPRHPEFPPRLRAKDPALRERLASILDPVAAELVERHADDYEAIARIVADAEQTLQSLPSAEAQEAYKRFVDEELELRLFSIWHAAERHGFDDVPLATRAFYLAERVLPEEMRAAVDHAGSGWFFPLEVGVNTTEGTTVIDLPPRHFYMLFTDASGGDRAAFDGIIQKAQRELGYKVNTGGRKPRDRDEELHKLAIAAAKLHWLGGLSFDVIDRVLELPKRGERSTGETAAQRGRRYVKTGEALLDKRDGSAWRKERRVALEDGDFADDDRSSP